MNCLVNIRSVQTSPDGQFSIGANIYGFSKGWESGLTIYIGVITFLMVFLIQRGQNKELSTLHVKLNELIATTKHADNRLINVEQLTEKEISEVQAIHRKIGTEDTEIKM